MTCCNFLMTTLYADGTRWQWCAACGKLVELNDDAPTAAARGSRQNAPNAADFRNRGHRTGKGQVNISHLCHGLGRLDLYLSPTFREELMGFPIGWTDLDQ